MERLRNLESLVKELRSQLEQVEGASSGAGASPEGSSPENLHRQHREANAPADAALHADTEAAQKSFGRLVLQDANRTRYVSSGFWSRVNDEVQYAPEAFSNALSLFLYLFRRRSRA